MQRLAFVALGTWGVLALSCQVLPSTKEVALPTFPAGADVRPMAPEASAGVPLVDTLAMIEGSQQQDASLEDEQASGRASAIRRVEAYLHQRHTALSRHEISAVACTIVDETSIYGLDVGLVLAVIQVESAGYHRAVSPVGALGLMQIMPATGKALAKQQGVPWRGPETLFDPVVNVRLGIAYLYELSDRYDHIHTALAAYNWGPGAIDSRIRRRSGVPELYVKQVMRAYDKVYAGS